MFVCLFSCVDVIRVISNCHESDYLIFNFTFGYFSSFVFDL